MNRKYKKECPMEFEILGAFHDGEPDQACASAREHLEECPRCREALREARELDALVAARTDTDIDEEKAAGFLAFLQQEKPALPVWKRIGLVTVAAAAVLVVAALVFHYARSTKMEDEAPGEQQAQTPGRENKNPPQRIPEPTPELEPEPEPQKEPCSPLFVPYVINLPGNMAIPYGKANKRSFTDVDFRKAFRGEMVSGLGLARLEARAETIFANPSAHDSAYILAAADWVLNRKSGGIASRQWLLALGNIAVANRQGLAGKLATLLRSSPDRLSRLAHMDMDGLEEINNRIAAINGTLGNLPAIRRLLQCPRQIQQQAAQAAARAGSNKSLTFLLDLHLQRSTRSSALASPHLLFANLPNQWIGPLTAILEKRINSTSRHHWAESCKEVIEYLKCRKDGLL